jgi:LacI family transcriptional regulator
MRDIATRADLSVATISNILGRRAFLYDPRTCELVRRLAKEMGYRPNMAARKLAGRETRVIRFIGPALSNDFWIHVSYLLQCQLKLDRYHLAVSRYPFRPENDGIEDADWAVDGQIVVNSGPWCHPILEAARASGQPLVFMGRKPPFEDCDYVCLDMYEGALAGLEHLWSIGCRRVAYVVTGPCTGNDPRDQAYMDFCVRHSVQPICIETPGSPLRGPVRQIVADYFRQAGDQRPDGLFAICDDLAIAACRALADLKIRVPQDVAVLGHDGSPNTEFQTPSITTVAAPAADMVCLAWQAMKQRILNPTGPLVQQTFRSQLLLRESTAR